MNAYALRLCAFSLIPLILSAERAAGDMDASPRHTTVLRAGWEFRLGALETAGSGEASREDWRAITLPHTWNRSDGQDGGNNYHRGPSCYRRTLDIPNDWRGKRLFLRFGAANTVADVYINGRHWGQHRGGFAAFCFEITSAVTFGAENELLVQVNNQHFDDVPPWSADFTFFGGLYRDVELLVTEPICISLLDFASPGVYLRPANIAADRADVAIETVLSNGSDAPASVRVTATISDAAGAPAGRVESDAVVAPGAEHRCKQSLTLKQPRLWRGRRDPYLYHVTIEIRVNDTLVDQVAQPLGLRTFTVDPERGLILNGEPFKLHGVNRHQDRLDMGWAIGRAEHDQDFALICEMGCTGVRLAHYQHDDYAYALCDRLGLVVWAEIPLVNRIADTPEFTANCRRQLRELIRQNYNHPSILFWGVHNEITAPWEPGPDATTLIRELAAFAKREDPSRLTVCAATSPDDHSANWQTDLVAFNRYFGWYHGEPDEFGAWADGAHNAHPQTPIGVSEYGAGADIEDHEQPVNRPQHDGAWHPEEWQAFVHERHWEAMRARPYLWCAFIWNMFDFASDARAEGSAPGRNDKGLVTYDRRTKKDAFYWYQANWSDEPMVHIVGKRHVLREAPTIEVRVYSNGDTVSLFVNGKSAGPGVRALDAAWRWPDVTLDIGVNVIRAESGLGAARVVDTCRWVLCAPQTTE